MKKIVILGEPEKRLEAVLSAADDFQLVYSASADVMPDTAGVLFTQQYALANAAKTVPILQRRNIPFAAAVFEASDEEQEALLDCGISNLLLLPMSASLLRKRLIALVGNPVRSDSEAGFQLFAQISESNQQRGAYVVQEADFTNIYRFVLRLQERMEKKAQLVIFSFHSRLEQPPEPGTLEQGFRIVQKCLRRGDITSVYGKKILAIMMAANADGGHTAAERIVNTYQAYHCDSVYEMRYEMRDIVPSATPLAG